jgi:hypothetical protein
MDLEVNPEALRQAADGMDAATASALDNVRYSLGPSADAAAANPDWQSASALSGCRQAWSEHLADLVNRTAGAAERLRSSARDYEDLESRVTDALEAIHWEPE